MNNREIRFILISAFLIIGGIYLVLLPFSGSRISNVIDGDTVVVNNTRVIRLARIDTPEYYEDGYKEAKDFMLQYLGHNITLDCEDELGYYGREICEVYYNGKSLNEMILSHNLGEVYR
jgi:endonuclease YncB( thermonuclease family)